MDTAIQEVLRRSDSVPGQARIGSKGLRGSQEYRWVTTGSGARLEMEAWLHHLDTDPPSVASFQLKWDQQRLVLSCSGLKEAAEASTGGAHVLTKEGGPAPVGAQARGLARRAGRFLFGSFSFYDCVSLFAGLQMFAGLMTTSPLNFLDGNLQEI
jgi:hypothetical protein